MNKVKFTNFFGKTGYFFGALQWLIVFALYFTWIATYFIEPMQPSAPTKEPSAPVAPPSSADEPSIILIIVAAVVVMGMVALTLYALWRIPGAVASAGHKVVEGTAKKAAPLVLKVQHKPENKKKVLRIQARFIVLLKVLMVLLPIGLAWLTQFLSLSLQVLAPSLALAIVAFSAVPVVFFFGLQYALMWVYKIPLKKIL